ncbi:hypothetical protein CDAR_465531 [Caerostris darwini]|uniref:Uncharacterized protein n=1 Tax=Caerostris darwini TaxID=1538125 RepID=A0AAV4TIA1_9ARAC|nr:hypothetical protein CDAR_465531 [Caerostris darwini]
MCPVILSHPVHGIFLNKTQHIFRDPIEDVPTPNRSPPHSDRRSFYREALKPVPIRDLIKTPRIHRGRPLARGSNGSGGVCRVITLKEFLPPRRRDIESRCFGGGGGLISCSGRRYS